MGQVVVVRVDPNSCLAIPTNLIAGQLNTADSGDEVPYLQPSGYLISYPWHRHALTIDKAQRLWQSAGQPGLGHQAASAAATHDCVRRGGGAASDKIKAH